MISLDEEITIPSPPAVVWPLLSDPALVASCVPGASIAPTQVLGVYEAALRVRLGPTLALFRGEVRLAYFPDDRRCTVEARGIDADGQSRAVAAGTVTAAGNDTTVLRVEGSATVTGPLEAAAEAAGAAIAQALLAEFAQSMTRLLTAEGMPAPDAEEIPLVEPETVSAQARHAIRSSAPAEEAPEEPEPRRGILSRLREILPGKPPQPR